ncbi:MAG: Flp pilus assembly protein CpaB [Actinomycetota bacterium]
MRRLVHLFGTPRALLAGCAALAVAAATATVVGSDLAALHRRARELGAPSPVVVAEDDLVLGAVVGADAVRTVFRYASAIPPDAVTDADDAVGRVVLVPLLAGTVVLGGNLAAADRPGLTGLVAPGTRAIRIEPIDGLRPPVGAVVDVLAAVDPTLGGPATSVVARAARVLAVDDGGTDEYTGNGRAGVTLLVTEEEAHGVAFALANGVLTLALAPPEDACCGSLGS